MSQVPVSPKSFLSSLCSVPESLVPCRSPCVPKGSPLMPGIPVAPKGLLGSLGSVPESLGPFMKGNLSSWGLCSVPWFPGLGLCVPRPLEGSLDSVPASLGHCKGLCVPEGFSCFPGVPAAGFGYIITPCRFTVHLYHSHEVPPVLHQRCIK